MVLSKNIENPKIEYSNIQKLQGDYLLLNEQGTGLRYIRHPPSFFDLLLELEAQDWKPTQM